MAETPENTADRQDDATDSPPRSRRRSREDPRPPEQAAAESRDPEHAGKADAVEGDQQFPKDDLIARATDYFGQPSYVVAAALHDSKDELTLDDAKAAIKKYLDSPAKEA